MRISTLDLSGSMKNIDVHRIAKLAAEPGRITPESGPGKYQKPGPELSMKEGPRFQAPGKSPRRPAQKLPQRGRREPEAQPVEEQQQIDVKSVILKNPQIRGGQVLYQVSFRDQTGKEIPIRSEAQLKQYFSLALGGVGPKRAEIQPSADYKVVGISKPGGKGAPASQGQSSGQQFWD